MHLMQIVHYKDELRDVLSTAKADCVHGRATQFYFSLRERSCKHASDLRGFVQIPLDGPDQTLSETRPLVPTKSVGSARVSNKYADFVCIVEFGTYCSYHM